MDESDGSYEFVQGSVTDEILIDDPVADVDVILYGLPTRYRYTADFACPPFTPVPISINSLF